MPPHGLCEYVYMPVHVNRVWMELDPSTIMRFHVCFIFFFMCVLKYIGFMPIVEVNRSTFQWHSVCVRVFIDV